MSIIITQTIPWLISFEGTNSNGRNQWKKIFSTTWKYQTTLIMAYVHMYVSTYQEWGPIFGIPCQNSCSLYSCLWECSGAVQWLLYGPWQLISLCNDNRKIQNEKWEMKDKEFRMESGGWKQNKYHIRKKRSYNDLKNSTKKSKLCHW